MASTCGTWPRSSVVAMEQERFQYWLTHMDHALDNFIASLPAANLAALDGTPGALDHLEACLHPSVAEALPQHIAVQRLGMGIVFQIGEHMPGPKDTAQVDGLRRVRQALGAAGKLGTRHLR